MKRGVTCCCAYGDNFSVYSARFLFSRVIVRAEPKLIAMELDVSQLRETLSAGKQQIAMILQEVAIATKQCEVLEIVLKEKELQWSKLKRCHLCLGENLTTKLREKSLQQGGGSGTGRSTSELGDASLDAASLKSSTTTAKEKGTRSVMKNLSRINQAPI